MQYRLIFFIALLKSQFVEKKKKKEEKKTATLRFEMSIFLAKDVCPLKMNKTTLPGGVLQCKLSKN